MVEMDINYNIIANKGDEFVLLFPLFHGSLFAPEPFEVLAGDKICLGVMEANMPFGKSLIQKTFGIENIDDNNNLVAVFEHDDTRCLLPGPYFYEIKLVRERESGEQPEVITLVTRKKFTLID